MKYSKEFLEANARLKTLDEETLNDELNKMSFDELLEHRDYMIQQELGKENQLSEEEAQEQIEELLQMTREPSIDEIQPIKIHTHRTGKRIAVLIAAILILVSVFTVAAVASKRDFSILNGIVRFEDGKVYVKFLRNPKESAMTLAELETDLREHGFDDVKIPGYFYENAWKAEDVQYRNDGNNKQSDFILEKNGLCFYFDVYKDANMVYSDFSIFDGTENAQSFTIKDITVYWLDHGKGRSEIVYFNGVYEYKIISKGETEIITNIIKSIY